MLRRVAIYLITTLVAGFVLVPVPAQAAQRTAPLLPQTVKIAVSIKKPVGNCVRHGRVLYAPSNRSQICHTDNLILGHAYPKPKKSGYLQQVVAKLKAGRWASYAGSVYRVAWVHSIPKAKLPTAFRGASASDVFLITCDTKSGYVNHHAKNNLVARLIALR
jgi:hypothetical protein